MARRKKTEQCTDPAWERYQVARERMRCADREYHRTHTQEAWHAAYWAKDELLGAWMAWNYSKQRTPKEITK